VRWAPGSGGSPSGTSWTPSAVPLYVQGDWASARPLFEQVREGFQSVGNQQGVAIVTVQLGLCALEAGDRHEACLLVHEGLELAREFDFRWGTLFGLGVALLAARMPSWEVAATLLGATELPRQSSPAPHIDVRKGAVAAVEAALDPQTLARLWGKGSAMPLDQAISYALQHL
jgi:hypothetical protein